MRMGDDGHVKTEKTKIVTLFMTKLESISICFVFIQYMADDFREI